MGSAAERSSAWSAANISQRLEADAAHLPMRYLLHLLHCLSRFLTTRMVQQSGRYEFIFAYSKNHKRADLGRATGNAENQLGCAISPMEAQCEAFLDVL